MRKLIIGYDFDGVGYFFGHSVARHLSTKGIEVEKPTDIFCSTWNFFDAWKMSEADFAKHCDEGVDAGTVFGPGRGLTRPRFFDSIRRVKEMGHTVIGITHRHQGSPGMAQRNTERWLAPVIDLFDDIIYSGDKTVVKTDMFVEDNVKNYDSLVLAGTNAFLINRPWNYPVNDGRNRISDIDGFTRAVQYASVATVV